MTEEQIKKLVQQESRKAAEEVYKKLGTKYGVASVPTHSHDGVDSVQLEEQNIINGTKYTFLLQVGSVGGGVFSFSLPATRNISRVIFKGFLANNADGSPATKRALVDAEIEFGRVYFLLSTGPRADSSNVQQAPPGTNHCITNNAMYIDTADLTNNRVVSDATKFVNVVAPTGSIFSIKFDGLKNNILFFTATISANMLLQGHVIIM